MRFNFVKYTHNFVVMLLATLACCIPSMSQSIVKPTWSLDTVSVRYNMTTVSLNYLGVFLHQERKLTRRTAFLYGGGMHYSFYSFPPIFGTRFLVVADPNFGREYSVRAITPFLAAEMRHYFTLSQRGRNNKHTDNNTADFVALFAEMPLLAGRLTETPNLLLAYPVGAKIGLRRRLFGRFYWESSVAVVGKRTRIGTIFVPRLDTSISFVLNKK